MSDKGTSENEREKCINTEDTFDKDTCFALFSSRTIDYFMKKNNLDKAKSVSTDKK